MSGAESRCRCSKGTAESGLRLYVVRSAGKVGDSAQASGASCKRRSRCEAVSWTGWSQAVGRGGHDRLFVKRDGSAAWEGGGCWDGTSVWIVVLRETGRRLRQFEKNQMRSQGGRQAGAHHHDTDHSTEQYAPRVDAPAHHTHSTSPTHQVDTLTLEDQSLSTVRRPGWHRIGDGTTSLSQSRHSIPCSLPALAFDLPNTLSDTAAPLY